MTQPRRSAWPSAITVTLGIVLSVLPADWIETSLGLAPDAHDGGLEAGIAILLIGVGVAVLWVRRARRAFRSSCPPSLLDDWSGS